MWDEGRTHSQGKSFLYKGSLLCCRPEIGDPKTVKKFSVIDTYNCNPSSYLVVPLQREWTSPDSGEGAISAEDGWMRREERKIDGWFDIPGKSKLGRMEEAEFPNIGPWRADTSSGPLCSCRDTKSGRRRACNFDGGARAWAFESMYWCPSPNPHILLGPTPNLIDHL